MTKTTVHCMPASGLRLTPCTHSLLKKHVYLNKGLRSVVAHGVHAFKMDILVGSND